jgi:hypothetical protein
MASAGSKLVPLVYPPQQASGHNPVLCLCAQQQQQVLSCGADDDDEGKQCQELLIELSVMNW